MKWSSLHIFYYDNVNILLTDCILKMYNKGYIDTFFFIRYWNGGPHIRLRIANKTSEQIIEIKKIVESYLKQYPSTIQLSNDEYNFKSAKFSNKEGMKALPLQKNNTIIETTYYPEMNKYIDNHALSLSENIFSISSIYALHILSNSNKKSELYYLSMQHTMYLLQYFIKEKATLDTFLENYFNYWQSFSEGQSIKVPKINIVVKKDFPEYNIYFEKIKKTYSYSEIQGLLFNYIHLFNNRLGINTKEEAFLAQCLLKYIRDGEC